MGEQMDGRPRTDDYALATANFQCHFSDATVSLKYYQRHRKWRTQNKIRHPKTAAHSKPRFSAFFLLLLIIIIDPLTARVVGAPQMISQQVSSILPCSPLPSRTWRTPACPLLDVVFPPLPRSASSSSPFHCALQDGFGQT